MEKWIPVITTLISVAGSLAVAFGTWHVSMKKDRDQTRSDIQKIINDNYDKTQLQIGTLKTEMESLKDDIAQVNATVQQQVAIIEVKVETLSNRVEKHNNVIERTYSNEARISRLEQAVVDLKDK